MRDKTNTEALGLDRFHLVGHHTGGVIAVEPAARFQNRVASLMLSAARSSTTRSAPARSPTDASTMSTSRRTARICGSRGASDRLLPSRRGGDHCSLPSLAMFSAALGCPTRVLSDGHVAAPEQVPQELAATVVEWIGRI